MNKEKILGELLELEELIKITEDKEQLKILKDRFKKLNKKLEKEEL